MTVLSSPAQTARVAPQLVLGSAGVGGLLVGAHIANDALTSMLSALLPALQDRLRLTDATLSLLVATLAFSASVTQPFFGAVSDRFGARAVAAAGTTFGISLLSLMTVAPNVAVLFGLLLVGGLGSAAFHPAATSVLAAVPVRRPELAMGLFSAGGTVGLGLGPVVVLAAAGTLGLDFTPWLILPAIGLGLAVLAGTPGASVGGRDHRSRVVDFGLVRGPVGLLAAAATLGSVASVTFSAAYPLHLVRAHDLAVTDPRIGLTLTVFNLGAAAGAVLGGMVASRVGPAVVAAGSTAAAIAPLSVLLVIAPSHPIFLATVAAAGALLNANLPVLLTAAHSLAPGRTAVVSGMLMGLPIGLAGLLYVGVGRLQEVVGLVSAMGLAFLSVIPAAVLVLVALRRAGRH